MPAHSLLPKHDPPTLWERIRFHTSDIWLYLMAIALGLIVIITPIVAGIPGSMALASMQLWLSLALSTSIITGGLISIIGLLWVGDTESHGWTLEISGCWLMAASWAGYAFAVWEQYPASGVVWGFAFLMTLAILTRAAVVMWIEWTRRREEGKEGPLS